ncbi:MAG: hypothetical protein PSV16_03185 [Flavobacterium sp.]|nr:hypothetical protein [Flavobacterium sp.]
MKNVKNTMLTFAIAFLFTIAANAQVQEEKKLSDEQKQEIIENVKVNMDRLALTEDQKAPFKEITKRYAEKLKAVKASDDSKIGKLKAAKSIIDAKNAEMKTLLTAPQYKTYLEIQDERKQKLRDKRKG